MRLGRTPNVEPSRAERTVTLETDLSLVERANRGDAQALETLYRRHRDWVTALARRFTGSADDALDVLQETFAYFFGKFPLRLTSSVRGFLYPVVRNKSTDVLRRRRKVVALHAATEIDLAAAWRPPDTDLGRAVAALAPGHREVVLLRFAHGMSLEEIAGALGIPIGTVKSRLHNALKSLRSREG